MTHFAKISSSIKYAASTIVSYSTPSPKTFTFALATSWYGKRVVLTYGPGILAKLTVDKTIKTIGNQTIGKILGYLFAPLWVPTITPLTANLAGGLVGWMTIVLCNIVARKVFGWQSKPSSETQVYPKLFGVKTLKDKLVSEGQLTKNLVVGKPSAA